MTEWQWRTFAELSNHEVYEVMAQRQHVFVLEQQCLWNDFDGLDRDAHHLLGWRVIDGKRQLAAYLRCLAPGAKYTEMSLGRVLTTKAARGSGIGRELVEQGIAACRAPASGPPHQDRRAAVPREVLCQLRLRHHQRAVRGRRHHARRHAALIRS